MYIEEIRQTGKYRYRLTSDSGRAFTLYSGDLRRYRIEEKMELPEEKLQLIEKECLIPRCRRKAMDLLVRADQTEEGLRRKLARSGFEEHIIADAVGYVQKFHYLDDERYAAQYIDQKKGTKSRRQIEMELKQKGIDKALIEDLMEETEDGDEAALDLLLAKRLRSVREVDDAARRKLIAYCARRGFSPEMARRRLETMLDNPCEKK